MKIIKPVDDQFPISSPYGPRIDPVTKLQIEFHKGIDFAVPVGTQVRSSFDGTIERVGPENPLDLGQGFGNRIWQTFTASGILYGMVFGHLSQIDVQDKMNIKAGEVLGLSGNTGKSTGPHLHVGVREWNSGNWIEIEL